MAHPANNIDLFRGHPSTELLATSQIAEAASIVLNSPDLPSDSYALNRHPLHYGPALGSEAIRKEIGKWTSERYELEEDIGAERVILTPGASYGLMTALLQCTSPVTGYTKRAFLVSPAYFLAAKVFEDAGFAGKLTAISSTSTSIDLAALRRHLQRITDTTPDVPLSDGLAPISRGGSKRIYKFVLYCVPTYSNPTGQTWDLETRCEVVKIAREWDMLVVSDDVYDFLGNEGDKTARRDKDGRLLPRLVTVERGLMAQEGLLDDGGEEDVGVTVSNCSFSKLLGPGLRCGWIETPTEALAKQIGAGGANISGGAPSHFSSTLIHHLVTTRKVDTVISNLQKNYTIRSKAIKSAIHRCLPEKTEIYGGNGGFFMWVGLPPNYDTREITKMALEGSKGPDGENVGGVRVMNGDLSECPGKNNEFGWGERWIRISVSYCSEEVAVEGVRRLGLAVERWEKGERSGAMEEGRGVERWREEEEDLGLGHAK